MHPNLIMEIESKIKNEQEIENIRIGTTTLSCNWHLRLQRKNSESESWTKNESANRWGNKNIVLYAVILRTAWFPIMPGETPSELFTGIANG